MRELRDRARLAPEALDVLRVVAVVGVQHLQRDVPLEQLVVRLVDARHAARADELEHLVALGDHVTDHRVAPRGGQTSSWRGSAHEDQRRNRPYGLRENCVEGVFPGAQGLVQLGVGDHERAEDAIAVRVGAGLQQQQAALRRPPPPPASRAPARAPSSPGPGRTRSQASRRGRGRRRSGDGAPAIASILPRIVSPMRSARSTRPSSSKTSRTASAAACATGLPTNVPPTAESPGRVHDLRLAEDARERQAGGDRLRDGHQVGLDAVVLHREHAPGAAEAGLHLVGDEHDPVLVADRAHAVDELLRRDDEAALALHGLEARSPRRSPRRPA